MNGKGKCKILKDIRRQIAKDNDIEFVTSECKYQGDCTGTCPKCEAEVRYLEQELAKRQKAGKAIAVAGIAAALVIGTAGCGMDSPTSSTPTPSSTPQQTGSTQTDPTKSPEPSLPELMGEPLIADPTVPDQTGPEMPGDPGEIPIPEPTMPEPTMPDGEPWFPGGAVPLPGDIDLDVEYSDTALPDDYNLISGATIAP